MEEPLFKPGDVVCLKNSEAVKYTVVSIANGAAELINMIGRPESQPVVVLKKVDK